MCVPRSAHGGRSANHSRRSRRQFVKSFHRTKIGAIVDNIGFRQQHQLTYNNTGSNRSAGRRHPDRAKAGPPAHAEYVRCCVKSFPRDFPDCTFSFLPADIASQILNFGSPAPIDCRSAAPNLDLSFDYANFCAKFSSFTGVADARIQQSRESRCSKSTSIATRAQYVGVTKRDVT